MAVPASSPPPPASTASFRFADIYVKVDGQVVDCRVVDDDLAGMLRLPAESFYRFRLPAGASRWAHVRVLMGASDLETLRTIGVGLDHPVEVFWGVLDGSGNAVPLADRMFVRWQPPAAWWTEMSGGVFAVDLVDARYYWNQQRLSFRGFNVTLDDKAQIYDATSNAGDPWTPRAAVEFIVDTDLIPYADASEFSWPTGGVLDSPLGLKDFFVLGQPAGRVIDRILAAQGHVLAANAKAQGGVRWQVIPIEQGGDRLVSFLAGNQDRLEHVGPAALAAQDLSALDGAVQQAIRMTGPLNEQMPSSVKVMFPAAMKEVGQYRFNDQMGAVVGRDYVVGRHHEVQTNGLPSGFTGNGQVRSLWDCEWAIFDLDPSGNPVLDNAADIEARADDVSAAWYGRYSSGATDELRLIRTVIADDALAIDVEWRMVAWGEEQGAWTILSAPLDDPLFGWRHDAPLTSYNVLSIGDVRALPRPDGGLLLDSPHVGGLSAIHPAHVTVVHSGFSATYDAIADDGSGLEVTNRAPDDRYTDPTIIEHENLPVGRWCFLAEAPFDEDDPVKLLGFERGLMVACPSPLLAAPVLPEARAAAAHGF